MVVARLRLLLFRREADDRIEAEFRFHIAMEAEKHVTAGLSPAAARQAAGTAFGGVERYKEEMRDGRGTRWLTDIPRDARFAIRSLAKSRAFSIAAIVSLALGVGANTAVFTVVNAVLFQSLPFRDADRVVTVRARNVVQGIDGWSLSFGELADYRASGAFIQLEGAAPRSFTLSSPTGADRVDGWSVTPGLFTLLGVVPTLGRSFNAEEAAPAGLEQVAIISDGLWRSRFGGDTTMVGKSIVLNGRQLQVIGVMPPAFRFPSRAELWLPLGVVDQQDRRARYIWGIGRLRDQASLRATQDQLTQAATRASVTLADTARAWQPVVQPFRDSTLHADARRLLYLLLGAVGLVLLIACGNLANLMLARMAERQKEIALRTSLGASKARIVRQLFTENILLAGCGTVLGVALATTVVAAAARALPATLPFWIDLSIDGRVLLYTSAIAIGATLVFGLAPAIQGVAGHEGGGMLVRGRVIGQTVRVRRVRSWLIIGEIALAGVLLTTAVTIAQSFLALQRATPGFDTRRLLSLRVTLSGDRYNARLAKAAYFAQVAERVATIPRVRAAAATTAIPAEDNGGPVTATVAHASGELSITSVAISTTSGFFDAIGAPLVTGRDFSSAEDADTSRHVLIVSRSFAERAWPNGDAVGQLVRLGDDWRTVIGVAADLQYGALWGSDRVSRPQVYLPYALFASRAMSLLVRTNGDPAGITQSVRAEIARLDPGVATYDVMTMAARGHRVNWPQRASGTMFGGFGIMALALAIAGIYGVMAYAVAQRRSEIAIRMALGASRARVLRSVLADGLRVSAPGVAIGIAGAAAAGLLFRGLLYGIAPLAIGPMAIVAGTIFATAMAACYLPARRAAGVSPAQALRSD